MKAAKPEKKQKESRSSLSFRSGRRSVDTSALLKIVSYAAHVILVMVLAFVTVKVYGAQIKCDNVSMNPGIDSGDIVLLDKMSFHVREPKVGDIVAFTPVSKVNTNYSIKRIVGLPGDTILIANGKLYVNGELINDARTKTLMKEAGRAAVELTVGEEEYFVLGDNRNISEDSRFESIGNIKKNSIVGRVYFNLSKIKGID